ncbi:hypothetical protein ACQPVP_03035 [Clostridium nigeriense]
MKRFIIGALCGTMVLSLVACGKSNIKIEDKNTNEIIGENSVEIPSPFKE